MAVVAELTVEREERVGTQVLAVMLVQQVPEVEERGQMLPVVVQEVLRERRTAA